MAYPLGSAYLERVYAGILGKIIGVYLGRPIEGMLRRDIEREFGQIDRYVHESRSVPLVVTDDDLSGTFTFLRALELFPDAGPNLSAAQIGEAWLNYIIENKSILWWGGMGMSTEHTAYLRLKSGVRAPASGSIALNSKVVAEQIGAQIFIDGWAMVCPGDPDMAASLAERAGQVSHDGEAVHAAKVIAAMEAAAFEEPSLTKLLDVAVGFIPRDSIIRTLIDDLREFRVKNSDWREAMSDLVEAKYGYDRYGGNCHVVPNHALIILALLYGDDDFSKSLTIVNTCGWDTDCNSGNVGCLLGIKNGLSSIDSCWRKPVEDRLLLPTADGGSCVTDALSQAVKVANFGRALRGVPPELPKNGAKFHFSISGSVQGWKVVEGEGSISNPEGSLVLEFVDSTRIAAPTFASPDELKMPGYSMVACPTLYPGQTVRAHVKSRASNRGAVEVGLFLTRYKTNDSLSRLDHERVSLEPGQEVELTWRIPILASPIAEIGLEFSGKGQSQVILEFLSWQGGPEVCLGTSKPGGLWATRQWVEACDSFTQWGKTHDDQAYVAIQNVGRGMAICGTLDWDNYRVSTILTPHLAKCYGIAARVQGLRRYYALVLGWPNKAQLVKVMGEETVLAEAEFEWRWNDDPHSFALNVEGPVITGSIDNRDLFKLEDRGGFSAGAIGLVIEEGRLATCPITVMAI